MFKRSHVAPLFAPGSQARALGAWREAATLVGSRWRVYLDAEPTNRQWAYASYVAALDVEEAAAAEMAALSPSHIAA